MIWRMGADNYGYWMLVQIFSIGGYVSLAELGFQGSITRYLSKFYTEENIEEFNKLFFSSLILFFFIGTFCCGAILFFNKYFFLKVFNIPNDHSAEMQLGLTIYACSFLFQFPAMVLKAYYTSIQDFFKLRLWEMLNSLIFAISIFFLMYFTTSVFSVIVTEIITYFILFVLFFLAPLKYYREHYALNIKYLSLKSLKNISGMTSYLFFYRIFGLIYNRTPQIFIAYFLAPAYMTYYEIIRKIPRALKQLQGMVNSAVLPLAVSLDTLRHQDKRKQLFLRGTRYSFLFLTPIVIFTGIYAEDILRLWIDPNYAFLANYLRIFVLWQYLNLFISFGSSMYTMTEHFGFMLPYYILGIALFLLIMVFFIEKFELWAVLLGLLFSSCIVIPSNSVLIKKINRFSLQEFFNYVLKFPVLLGSLFSMSVLLLIKTSLPADNITMLLIYGGVTYFSYMAIFYKFCLFDFEKKDIDLLLNKFGHA
jgi:O-antigen/teichoic acid export membrane protein